jgi:hypothetical protein
MAVADDIADDRGHHQAPPTRARSAGISWNASHTQNGISGVSSVAIKVACPDGNSRQPSTNNVSPKAT